MHQPAGRPRRTRAPLGLAAALALVLTAGVSSAGVSLDPAPEAPATATLAGPAPGELTSQGVESVDQAARVATARLVWRTYVANRGGQGAVDRCRGGLTRWTSNIDGKPYYPIHRGCGGSPILALRKGNLVRIGKAKYVVSDSRVVHKGDSVRSAYGMRGQVLVQTCYRNSKRMRIVALTRV